MVKAGAIIVGGILALYVLGLLLVIPATIHARGVGKAMALNMHGALYAPVRDAMPGGNPVRVVWLSYQDYWCDQGGCDIAGSGGSHSVKKMFK